MGQVLHGCATTTEAVRRAIQHSQKSLRALAKHYGINQKTVAKWRKRSSIADLPTGPKEPKSTVLSVEDEAIIVAFRRYTLLPLDDCLYALQATLPHLTRSSLHRCLQRHGISRLPEVEGDKPDKRKFKTYPIGYFHVDIAEVRTEEGRLYLFVAIDRTSKFAFVELHEKATMRGATDFLQALIKAVPYKIHTVLTDNGIQFADLAKNRSKPTAMWRGHPFDRACQQHGIEHRLTKPNHPWTNGQVERMNRTIKEATVQRYYYETHDQLRRHLADFVMAYNFARRLKTLSGLTPSPPPACARPSFAPPPPWRGSAKDLLKRDTARGPMLPSLFEPFPQAHPRVRGKRLLTIRVDVP
jgi:transposase InsO family protein